MPHIQAPHRAAAFSYGAALALVALIALGVSGCGRDPAILIKISADAQVDQYDLYIRDDATQAIILHSGFNPVLAPGEKSDDGSNTRDLTKNPLKIAVKLSKAGKFTLLIVGVAGALEGGKPGAGATQLFWAAHIEIDGANEIDARLLTVQPGDDKDGDLWPDATDFVVHTPEAAALYAGRTDLLDCDDKTDNPIGTDGVARMIRAESINPFANEICGDNFDENCNGPADDPCVDADGDGDPKGHDCDDNDPARHKSNVKDPFPDPPNCCGYSLGMAGTADEHKNFTGDPLLCPTKRCGDGIDESCRGNSVNDPANDTACVVDADCDGYPAAPQGDDCDDNDPNIHPGALEICGNGKNESCSASGPDSGCVPCDLDGDGYQRNDAAANCPDATNQHAGMFDCNDNDAGVYPGSSSVAGNKEGGVNAMGRIATALKGLCRRVYEPTGVSGTGKVGTAGYTIGDADCNGAAYEGCPPPSCDADGDGWPANDCGIGFAGPYDCNDNDPTIFPAAPDHCGDGIDGNCSGADTPCAGMDKDGDGYLPPSDCDDSNPNVHPFALEKCNGIDDDCDGDKDEGNPDPMGVPLVTSSATASCTDDNDGECGKTRGRCVCSPTTPVVAQDIVSNRMLCSGETSGGGRVPHCFGAGQPHKQTCGDTLNVDDDCDKRLDDPTGTNLATKGMPCGLSLGVCKPGVVVGCLTTPTKTWYGASPPPGKSHWECSADTIPAGLSESCNGYDDDCDGSLPANEVDGDGDKYIACSGCGGAGTFAGMLVGCNDCDPSRNDVYPGAPELCDGRDNNCNTIVDETPNICGGMSKTCCYATGGVCQDLTSDTNYCGACNNTCAGKTFVNTCQGSACVCKNKGSACNARNWCNGGNAGGTCELCNTTAHCGDACTACTAPNICKTDGSGCTGCNVDTDCDATRPAGTFYCVGGTCLAKKALGVACTVPSPDPNAQDNECLGTAYCTDGVCCDRPTNMCGGCLACNRNASKGTCSIVQPGDPAPGPDPHNYCAFSLGTCTVDNCNGSSGGVAGCYAASNTACSAPSCVDNAAESHTQQKQCDAAGGCGPGQTTLASCGDYKCNGAACFTSCTSSSQCQSGKPNCWLPSNGGNGNCYANKVAGTACVANAECDSGACIGGTCCGMGMRPNPSCGVGVTTTTTCSAAGNTLTTYTCNPGASPKWTQCTTGTGACPNNVTCDPGGVICAASCTCSGAYPCSNPRHGADTSNCTVGNQCVMLGDIGCIACGNSNNVFCGATCADCTANTPACAGGDLTGITCSTGACTGVTQCLNNFGCASASTCRNKCSDDTGCRPGYWCKGTAPNGTCVLRSVKAAACDTANDTTCAGAVGGTTCNQCADADHISNLKPCGAGPNCP